MKFKTRAQCALWCDTNNRFLYRVLRLCEQQQDRLDKSGEPRLRALSGAIYNAEKHFHTAIRKEMERIESVSNGDGAIFDGSSAFD